MCAIMEVTFRAWQRRLEAPQSLAWASREVRISSVKESHKGTRRPSRDGERDLEPVHCVKDKEARTFSVNSSTKRCSR